MHIYRWDLDKTYLETDFDSLRGLVRSATEPARRKRAVPGATALMRALGMDPTARIAILSGSPKQMREVLEKKLRLDGVRYDSFTLKETLRHLRKGQVRAIKGQFGYKLPALLEGRSGLGIGAQETLFGDDAEVDALVYSVYADALAGRLRAAQVSRLMESAGAYPEHIDRALAALSQLDSHDAVERIFIRLERKRPPATFAPLGTRVVPVHSWWQAALVLYAGGRIDKPGVDAVLTEVIGRGADRWSLASHAQDIVRRGHAPRDVLDGLGGPSDVIEACVAAVARLGWDPPLRAPAPPVTAPDYLGLIKGW